MHVMLDLETLGQSPRALILEIAMVGFDPRQGGVIHTEDPFNVHVCINDQRVHGREFEKSTVLWWMQRPPAAIQHIVDGQLGATSLRIALWRLRVWLRAREVTALWAKNMAFDIGILRDAYCSLGEDIPWHYRVPRDLRSYFEPRDPPKLSFDGTEHSAVADCVHQIRQLQVGWRG
jgi:hypothetical protein